jgi:hypothetical protein
MTKKTKTATTKPMEKKSKKKTKKKKKKLMRMMEMKRTERKTQLAQAESSMKAKTKESNSGGRKIKTAKPPAKRSKTSDKQGEQKSHKDHKNSARVSDKNPEKSTAAGDSSNPARKPRTNDQHESKEVDDTDVAASQQPAIYVPLKTFKVHAKKALIVYQPTASQPSVSIPFTQVRHIIVAKNGTDVTFRFRSDSVPPQHLRFNTIKDMARDMNKMVLALYEAEPKDKQFAPDGARAIGVYNYWPQEELAQVIWHDQSWTIEKVKESTSDPQMKQFLAALKSGKPSNQTSYEFAVTPRA